MIGSMDTTFLYDQYQQGGKCHNLYERYDRFLLFLNVWQHILTFLGHLTCM